MTYKNQKGDGRLPARRCKTHIKYVPRKQENHTENEEGCCSCKTTKEHLICRTMEKTELRGANPFKRSHKSSRLKISSEYSIPHVPDNPLSSFSVNYTRKMCIENPAILIIPSMDLQEMRSEVLHDRIIII